jgi:hypothetical protein
MKIYIVSLDGGVEGYGAPEAAFTTQEAARAFIVYKRHPEGYEVLPVEVDLADILRQAAEDASDLIKDLEHADRDRAQWP